MIRSLDSRCKFRKQLLFIYQKVLATTKLFLKQNNFLFMILFSKKELKMCWYKVTLWDCCTALYSLRETKITA